MQIIYTFQIHLIYTPDNGHKYNSIHIIPQSPMERNVQRTKCLGNEKSINQLN